MTSETLLASLVPLVIAHIGALFSFAIAPLFLALVLEGIVLFFRGKGLKPLIIAALLVAGLAILGGGMQHFTEGSLSDVNRDALNRNAEFYLIFSVSLSILAFAIRMGKQLIARD
jgi:hypothetical protein